MLRTLKGVGSTRKTRDRAGSAGSVTRAQAAADAIGSVRAEGLDPGRAESLLAAWARGELTDEQLEQASRELLRDRSLSVEELLADVRREPDSGGGVHDLPEPLPLEHGTELPSRVLERLRHDER